MLALCIGLLGLLLPVRFESVHPAILTFAGERTQSVPQYAGVFLDFAKPGPAALLLEAAEQMDLAVEEPLAKLEAMEIFSPIYRLSGGSDPFFEQFLKLLDLQDGLTEPAEPVALNRLLASRNYRQQLLGFLENSNNQGVKTVLDTRDLTGLQTFMPVSSAAGAPFDTACLTTALLIQAGHWNADWVVQLTRIARQALAGDPAATARLEDIYMAILSSAKTMNWLQLAEWVKAFNDVDTFVQGSAWLREADKQRAIIYSLCVMSADTDAALAYYETYGVAGAEDMQQALALGKGALDYLLLQQSAIYERPKWLTFTEPLLQQVPWVVSFVFNYPLAARILMFCLLGGAGILLSFGLKGVLCATQPNERVSGTAGWTKGISGIMQHLAVGVLVVAAFILLNEPNILGQKLHEPGKLLLEFEMSPQANNVEKENMSDPTIDQVTIVVLLIFLFVQFIIYSLCLFKLAQIKNAKTTAELKLKLLDNEDVLFDMGLYVGLSGTVISLLMLAMGIVQASLVAAYASTLFGIIFVALLKVLHLRPLRRKYILEAAQKEATYA